MSRPQNKVNKLYFCSHCDEDLSRSCYYRHRRLYYNQKSKEWCKSRSVSIPVCVERSGQSSSLLPDMPDDMQIDAQNGFNFESDNSGN